MESLVMNQQNSRFLATSRRAAICLSALALMVGCGGGGSRGPTARFVAEPYKVTPTDTVSVDSIRDTRTGIVWARDVGFPAGSTTARLPSAAELLTLADSTSDDGLREAFPFLFGKPATTLDIDESDRQPGGRIWAVDFGEEVLKGALGRWSDGTSVGERPAQWYVLAPTSPLRAPGDYLVGTDAGIVSSRTAGLMWKTCAEGMTWNATDQLCDGTPGTYDEAQARVLADQANALDGYANRKGWRLPTKQELQSLLVLSGQPLGEPLVVAPLADKDPSGISWERAFRTSDTSVGTSSWAVHFLEGEVQPTVLSSDPLHVRLVRAW
jgi:hypothetical protein